MKNRERRMKWSVYSEQTNPFSASANIDYRDLKHLKDLLKQTLTGKRKNDLESRLGRLFLTGVSSSELLSSSSDSSDWRSSTIERSGPTDQNPEWASATFMVVWLNFQTPTLKVKCNFCATTSTRLNWKNNDCFQTDFLKTPPTRHWLDKQNVSPEHI